MKKKKLEKPICMIIEAQLDLTLLSTKRGKKGERSKKECWVDSGLLRFPEIRNSQKSLRGKK